jgi:thiol-disulfide isomerase/thioredoxin
MVAIDFWTTWCARCRDELPILEKLANELKGRGVVIFAVNVGEDEATVRRFLQENHLSVPVLLGGEDTIVLNYKVEAYPTLAVIDRNGDLSSKFAGGAGEADLRRTLGVE